MLGRVANRLAMLWLGVMSFVFYIQAEAAYALLLAASIIFNFACGRAILHLMNVDRRTAAKVVTAFAVSANLATLAYYKYGGFVVANVTATFGLAHSVWAVVLPVGISFFTFTQIAYLAPTHSEAAPGGRA